MCSLQVQLLLDRLRDLLCITDQPLGPLTLLVWSPVIPSARFPGLYHHVAFQRVLNTCLETLDLAVAKL